MNESTTGSLQESHMSTRNGRKTAGNITELTVYTMRAFIHGLVRNPVQFSAEFPNLKSQFLTRLDVMEMN